ncbi:type III secretion system translocon subunit SctE [Yersinia pekkanenii]|uniref:Secretion system effector protein SseC n=1 Tax=Yersinia pekkanenii TaxID=1288385 RepID=A0A0T9QRD6_9GAMM|nr:type III secretion system translocon subunit SctE [Yersinia pekkanenii]CNI24770.1 secretion system effector protein SseC [Yersinia pekkanenii]CRY68898.1 secretion system effector protein SseC [Yersinia pekkanenii]
MSNSIVLNMDTQTGWAIAATDKNEPLVPTKMPNWRAIAGLTPMADTDTTSARVSQQAAQGALDRLLVSLPFSSPKAGGSSRLSLEQLGSTDIQLIMSMVGNLSLGIFSDLCKSIRQQVERATDVQIFLRDKRVTEYQQQIDKAVEQADKAHKAGIFNAVFDWVIGAVEVVYGALKVAEGVLTGDPVAITSGITYLAAGTAGLVKAAAETAMLLGASKEKCQEVIDVAGKVQLGCECFAMAIDLFQAARAINAARAVSKGAGEVLKAGGAEALTEAIKRLSNKEVQLLTEQFAKNTCKQLVETEMTLVRNITPSFTHAGIEKLVGDVTKDLIKVAINKGTTLTAEQFSRQCSKKIMEKMIQQIIKDISLSPLRLLQMGIQGLVQINCGQLAIQKAGLQKEIEELMLDQDFTQFMDEWVDRNKQQQIKQLKNIAQNAQDTIEKLNDNIHQNGMLQAKIAGSLI